jgi:hypothetical protein
MDLKKTKVGDYIRILDASYCLFGAANNDILEVLAIPNVEESGIMIALTALDVKTKVTKKLGCFPGCFEIIENKELAYALYGR